MLGGGESQGLSAQTTVDSFVEQKLQIFVKRFILASAKGGVATTRNTSWIWVPQIIPCNNKSQLY